jgi:hypothetical protein
MCSDPIRRSQNSTSNSSSSSEANPDNASSPKPSLRLLPTNPPQPYLFLSVYYFSCRHIIVIIIISRFELNT